MITLPLLWTALLLAGAWRVRPRVAAPRVATGVRRLSAPGSIGLALAAVVAAVAPIGVGAVAAGALWAAPILSERRARHARDAEILRSIPEIVDLFHLAVAAGMTVPLAVRAVARHATGPVADALRDAVTDVDLGRRLADALGDVPARSGEVTRPLVDALVASDRYGAPLADALGRLASEVRADRRRRAEEAARRVPVKLLFPLVCCVLPAFGLLTLAPLIAGAVAALRL